jgi:phosphatidylglycerol---prolipoprotein diacylglyceryl transferase
MHPVLLTLHFGSTEVVLGSYSTFYALAWVVALALGTVIAFRRGLPWRRALLLYAVALVIGIMGARLLDVATNWGAYAEDPGLAYSPGFRGFSLYGGLVLAIGAGALLSRPLRLPLWRLADSAVPAMAAALVLMRTGCYLRGCCFGTVTSVPWGVTFPTGSPAWTYQLASGQSGVLGFTGLVRPVHPTQIYELIAALVFCGVALWLMPRRRSAGGAPPAGSGAAGNAKGLRRSVDGLPFLVFILGFTLFRVAEYYLRPRPLTATGPGWFYPALYSVIIVGVAAVLVWRTASARRDA